MLTADQVAKFFLSLSEPMEGDSISNLKLQKLCYYAQGFALAVLDRPLFEDAIEAWEHGPVVESLYHRYKDHGANGIPVPSEIDFSTFSKEEAELLREVWNVYGQFSAWKLRNMTHEEPPWKEATRGAVITHEALKKFFRTRVGQDEPRRGIRATIKTFFGVTQ